MHRVNKHYIDYQNFGELPEEIKYRLIRKGYNVDRGKNISLSILSIEYYTEDPKEKIRHLEELSQPLMFFGKSEIEKGEKDLKKLEQDERITSIEVTYYSLKNKFMS